MAKFNLPTDRLTVHGLPVADLLAFHHRVFGDLRMDGEGGTGSGSGSASGEGGDGSGGDSGGNGGAGGGSGTGGTGSDAGFLANTPLEQMTVDQREAYWKHQARKHEDRVKAYGGLTPEQVAEFREKAGKHDALERELMSDKDKAVAEATDKAKAEARAEFTPKLVSAAFRTALVGRVEADKLEERLSAIVDPLDLSKFLTAEGDVDTAKVSAFVENIAPATGTSTTRKGPTATGHGSGAPSGLSGLSGSDLYDRLHPKKTA